MKNETPRIIRVVIAGAPDARVSACGWYRLFGQVVLYVVRDGRRLKVAEFDSILVTAVIDTTAEAGKGSE